MAITAKTVLVLGTLLHHLSCSAVPSPQTLRSSSKDQVGEKFQGLVQGWPVCLLPEAGQFQPVCPKVLVKCKSSNIQHENVGEWFEFLRQIPFVNIAILLGKV